MGLSENGSVAYLVGRLTGEAWPNNVWTLSTQRGPKTEKILDFCPFCRVRSTVTLQI